MTTYSELTIDYLWLQLNRREKFSNTVAWKNLSNTFYVYVISQTKQPYLVELPPKCEVEWLLLMSLVFSIVWYRLIVN